MQMCSFTHSKLVTMVSEWKAWADTRLQLANALSQNCGPPMHRELASRSFTDALLRLAGDRVSLENWSLRGCRADNSQTTHQQVKSKIVERMGEWTEMFASNTELGIMDQAYMKLKSQSERHFEQTLRYQQC